MRSILGLRVTSTSNVLLFVTFLKELSSLILLFVGFGPILGRPDGSGLLGPLGPLSPSLHFLGCGGMGIGIS